MLKPANKVFKIHFLNGLDCVIIMSLFLYGQVSHNELMHTGVGVGEGGKGV
jgi:hypothetical protein